MISKNMYEILKEIPHSPEMIAFKEMQSKEIVDINLLKNLLMDAKSHTYIAFYASMPNNDILKSKFGLTEEGQIAIEEYEGTKYNTKLSIWAIVISGLSFLASVAAIIISCIV